MLDVCFTLKRMSRNLNAAYYKVPLMIIGCHLYSTCHNNLTEKVSRFSKVSRALATFCRLQEQSDLNAFKDLMGSEDVDLATFEPKSAKDFDNLARTLVNKHILPYEKDAKFKGLLKAFMKNALAESDVQQVKDLEACLAGIRADKLKEEKAAAAARKGGILLEFPILARYLVRYGSNPSW